MFKKILSAALVLAMALSVVGALQMTSFASDTLSYTIYPGSSAKGLFRYTATDANRRQLTFAGASLYTTWTGFGTTQIPLNDSRSNCGGFTSNIGSAPNGVVGQWNCYKPDNTMKWMFPAIAAGAAYASDADLAALESTQYFVRIDEVETPAIYLNFDPTLYDTTAEVNSGIACTATKNIHYLIIVKDDEYGTKQWFPIMETETKDDLAPGTYEYDPNLIPSGYAQNNRFCGMWNNAPYMYQSTDGKGIATGLKDINASLIGYTAPGATYATSTGAFASPRSDDASKPKGTYIYKFEYYHDFDVAQGKAVPQDPGITLTHEGTRLCELMPGSISLTADSSSPYYVNDGKGTTERNGAMYVASGADINGVLTNDDVLTPIKVAFPYVKGTKNTVILVFDFNQEVIRYFFNGLPVYFGAKDGKFYDELVYSKSLSQFTVHGQAGNMIWSANRDDVAVGINCYFSNIMAAYSTADFEVNSKVDLKTALYSKGPNWTEDLNAYQGFALTANIKGVLNKMKWVFNTEDMIYYSDTITFESPVEYDGDVTFGAVIKNGTAIEGNLGSGENIVDVDAIFQVGANNVYTNYFYSTKIASN